MRQYQKIGEFWLPAKDETFVHVRLYGKKILTIDHRDYAINSGTGGRAQDRTTENGERTVISLFAKVNGTTNSESIERRAKESREKR